MIEILVVKLEKIVVFLVECNFLVEYVECGWVYVFKIYVESCYSFGGIVCWQFNLCFKVFEQLVVF